MPLNPAPITAVELRRKDRLRRCCTLSSTWIPHCPLQVTQRLGLFQTHEYAALLKTSLTEPHP